jgi:hypothetical protein
MQPSLTNGAVQNLQLQAGGTYGPTKDANAHRLFDVRSFGALANDYTYFVQPIGVAFLGGYKTLNETNMQGNGQLPQGQAFTIRRLGIALINITGATSQIAVDMLRAFNEILASSVFEIKVAGREWDYQIHGRNFLPMPGQVVGTLANGFRVGDEIASGWVSLDPTPIVIGNLVNFSVIQHVQNAVGAITTLLNANSAYLSTYYGLMQVTLDGFLTRSK